MLGFSYVPKEEDLIVAKETEDMVLYGPFLLLSPRTSDEFPPSDEVYYEALEAQLVHLLYKFEHGWIQSERQVFYTSDECISSIHFVFDENKKVSAINVFQRSSNLLNLEDDAQFFNYFIKKHLGGDLSIKTSILVSMPHIFKGKTKKVEG